MSASEANTTPSATASPDVAESEESNTQYESNVASGEMERIEGKRFGTFQGVFKPTILTILGLMMYLREGWLVGNNGLGGALLVIMFAYLITGTTALAISSITTNIRLGAGGVFSIVSQSLGLEVGGSIGIPFYLAQGISTAMYIYGFAEGWQYIFPDHNLNLVSVGLFCVVFVTSYFSTSLAFRVQLFVMIGVILALGSIFTGLYSVPTLHRPEVWGTFESASFWTTFAIFFPAATGIMVGASMSGNLKDPRKSIPVGTMAAWGLSFLVYTSLAVWYSMVALPEELLGNKTIVLERSFYGHMVLAGILLSTFTAALSSFVAAPRILQTLGKNKIVPKHEFFAKLVNGEPRNAMVFTGSLVLITLLLGDLDAIAQLLTMFFLLTYFTINVMVLVETRLHLISFRPAFKVGWFVPLVGALACLSAILIISPFLGLISILIIISLYVYLNGRGLENPWDTVESGILLGIAHWAAKKVFTSQQKVNLRTWKPDLLVPIERRTQLEGQYRLMRSLVYPQGALHVVAMMKERDIMPLLGLKQVIKEVQSEGIYASSAIIDSQDFIGSLETSVAVMKGAFFEPNTIFASIDHLDQSQLQGVVDLAKKNNMGVVLFALHPESGLGREKTINLWIRDQSPNWKLSFKMANIDLSLLLAYKLMGNWEARLRVLSVVYEKEYIGQAEKYLRSLMESARIPPKYTVHAEHSTFMEYLERSPRADINIMGLANVVNKEILQNIVATSKKTCLFVMDSGRESALA